MNDIKKKSASYIKKVIGMLKQFNLMHSADEASLQMLRDTYELYLLCKADVEANGLTIVGANQRTITNPNLTMQLKCVNTVLSILKDFGISSRSRQVLMNGEPKDESDSPLSRFLEEAKED